VTQPDRWRELLEQANDVPGRIQARPGAGAVLRARARRRARQQTAAALAAGCLLIGGAGLAAANLDAFTGARAGQPAGRSRGAAPGPVVGDLATPIEIHLVERSGTCPMDGGVPAWDGKECFRLGPVQLRIRAVTRATFGGPAASPTQPGAAGVIDVELTQADRAAFADLTGAHVGQRIAVVVDDRVLGAPQIAERIDAGVLLVPGSQAMIDWAAAHLTP
jgi:hypothetical protein